jgi:hypothetical protein
VITLEDWALIRRLAAEGVPKARIADRLGISRTTVIKAVSSLEYRHQLLHAGDLLAGQQDVRVFEGGFHPLAVGDHVQGDCRLRG